MDEKNNTTLEKNYDELKYERGEINTDLKQKVEQLYKGHLWIEEHMVHIEWVLQIYKTMEVKLYIERTDKSWLYSHRISSQGELMRLLRSNDRENSPMLSRMLSRNSPMESKCQPPPKNDIWDYSGQMACSFMIPWTSNYPHDPNLRVINYLLRAVHFKWWWSNYPQVVGVAQGKTPLPIREPPPHVRDWGSNPNLGSYAVPHQ